MIEIDTSREAVEATIADLGRAGNVALAGVLRTVLTARDARIRAEGRREGVEEALMRVPGGDVCNPQDVADAIRALLDKPAKGGADE